MGEQLTGQDIQVYQSATGRVVFHTVVTPVQRMGQNFSLSADGSQIAVVRDGAIEVDQLPPLSGRDKQEVKTSREFALDRASGLIRLPTRARVATMAAEAAPSPHPPAPPVIPAAPTAVQVKPQPVENPVNVGDVPPAEGRKRPTLYESGESAPK